MRFGLPFENLRLPLFIENGKNGWTFLDFVRLYARPRSQYRLSLARV